MRERMIVISLVLSLFGITTLTLLSHIQHIQEYSIGEVERDFVGRRVRVEGRVESVWWRNGTFFITICDDECIKAILFNDKNVEVNPYLLRRGDVIEILGKVKMYKGNLEIVCENIRLRG